MEATVSKCGVRMQSQMALILPIARNPGLEGASRMGNGRCISTAELRPGLVGQAGVHMSALPSILSSWAASGEGPSTCLLKLLPAPWLPGALCHSKQRTWEFLSPKDGMDASHILSSSFQVGLIYFAFHCDWVINKFYINTVGKLTSLRIKLGRVEPLSLSLGRSPWAYARVHV